MSENITHVAVCDDATRLASRHPDVEPLFKRVLDERRDAARLGAVTRGADRFTAKLVTLAREEFAKPDGERDGKAEDKLAFVLGALTHRAADRLMKPVIRCHDETGSGDGKEARREATTYMDVFVWREVFGEGRAPRGEPYPKPVVEGFAGVGGGLARGFEECFRVAWQRALIGMHTFAPDMSEVDAWLGRLLDTRQEYTIELERYARVAAEWDAAKVGRYLTDTHFYDRDDRVIRVARAIQRGEEATGDDVLVALGGADKKPSRYARALAKALGYLLAAGRLFRGEIEEDEAAKLFDVGVPELSLGFERPG